MNRKKSQSGSAHLAIIITLLIALVGVLGFVVWNNFVLSKQSPVAKANSVTTKKDVTPIGATNGWKTYAGKITGVASLKCPSDWLVSDMYPNDQGVTLKSPDFVSETGFYNITKGSSVTVTASITDGEDSDESLFNDAMSIANTGYMPDDSIIDLNGERVIKFSHHAGENSNNQTVILFYRNNIKYNVTQQYHLDSDNPYPELLNEIVSSVKFN